jgi:replicative DNA helicase
MTDAPHSEAAEQSVVGQMLANPACIGDVTGTLLDGSHFFLSAHRVLYDAIVESFYADDPTDPLTIAETCGPRLAKLWGLDEKLAVAKVQSYANGHTLAADPVDHARVVKRHADLRALLGVAATIEREVAAEQHPPEQIAGIVSSEAMKIATGTLTAHEVVSFGDAGRRFIQAMRERVALKQAGVEPGVKFNIAAIDGFTKGVQPTELVIGGGESGVGKALALDTPLPTPTGWTTQGDAEPGTLLFDEAGEVCVVRAVSEIWNGRPCFRVRFSDGESIVADAEHEWVVGTARAYMHAWRRGDDDAGAAAQRLTTSDLHDAQERGERRASVAVAQPLYLGPVDLPIPPYTLGAWLGDGTSACGEITCAKPDHAILGEIAKDGFPTASTSKDGLRHTIVDLRERLSGAGLLGEKRIPASYLRAGLGQRLDLLQGIVDTDGHVSTKGRVEITLMNEQLAYDVRELVETLGSKATLTVDRARVDGRYVGDRYRVRFLTGMPVARLARKVDRLRLGLRKGKHARRVIVAVEPVESVPVRCLSVSSESHLYLAGERMVPTHNSGLWWIAAKNYADSQYQRPPGERVGTLILSLEMGELPSSTRFAQGMTHIESAYMREGTLSTDELRKIVTEWKRRKDWPLWLNYASGLRLSQLRALVAEAIRKHGVGLVVVDHFLLLEPDQRMDSNEADDERVRFLKNQIAKDLNVAVVCLAHTRKSIERADKRPRLSDLRGSGMISAFADYVMLMFRPWQYASEKDRSELRVHSTDAEMIHAKNRHGIDGMGEFYFDAAKQVAL